MSKRYHLNVVIDADLEKALRKVADQQNVTVSAIVRTIMREALKPGSADPVKLGWLEGVSAGEAAVRRALGEVMAKLRGSEPST